MVLLCLRLILIVSPRPILGYVFLWFSNGFPMFLICFRLILIVCPRPIFGYLTFSHGFPMVFLWFCHVSGWFESSALARSSVILWFPMVLYCFPIYGLTMFLIDFNRQPSPDPRLCFPMVFQWFPYVFDMFPFDFNRLPSPDLWLSNVLSWFSYGFPMILICFRLI